jgi:hypothetical protein
MTTSGDRPSLTFWVSRSCVKCAFFAGIEAFDTGDHYWASQTSSSPPSTPKPLRVSNVLPSGSIAAIYIQVPEHCASARVDLVVDDASPRCGCVPSLSVSSFRIRGSDTC